MVDLPQAPTARQPKKVRKIVDDNQLTRRRDGRQRRTTQDSTAGDTSELATKRIASLPRYVHEGEIAWLLRAGGQIGLVKREVHLTIANGRGLLHQMVAR